jgi:hypothetical protein
LNRIRVHFAGEVFSFQRFPLIINTGSLSRTSGVRAAVVQRTLNWPEANGCISASAE